MNRRYYLFNATIRAPGWRSGGVYLRRYGTRVYLPRPLSLWARLYVWACHPGWSYRWEGT